MGCRANDIEKFAFMDGHYKLGLQMEEKFESTFETKLNYSQIKGKKLALNLNEQQKHNFYTNYAPVFTNLFSKGMNFSKAALVTLIFSLLYPD